MGQARETHLDKVCYTCGDVGFGSEELIKACSRCTNSSHPYCMRVVMRDTSEDWICEVCLPKNDIDSLNPGQAENVLDSSKKVRFDLRRQVACKRQKAVETGKVKFLPTEEVIKMSFGVSKMTFPSNSNVRSKPANFTLSPSKRTYEGSKNAGTSFNQMNVRRNHTYLDLGSARPRGVQINTSINRQCAVEIPKKTKEDEEKASWTLAKKHGSANVVPNKENFRKGKISNTILPDQELPILRSNTEEAMRCSRLSSSRQHTTIISAGQNFHDAAEPGNSDFPKTETWNRRKVSLYRPHAPSLYPTWTGCFKFPDTATLGDFYGGFLAQPPCRVHRKAYELSKKMPPVLHVHLLQQCHLQADISKNGCLDLCDIALYFYPVDYVERFASTCSSLKCSSQKNYNHLFELMVMKNSVMISYIDDMELLIFTSQQLNTDSRDVSTKSNANFFGGFFRCAEENRMKVHQKLPSLVSYTDDANANTDSGKDVDMDIDMMGGKIAGISDMVVSKESLPEFNKWAAKGISDAICDGKFLTVSGDLNSTIRPISVEPAQECCNDTALPSKSTEKIKSKFPVEPPSESSLGRFLGSIVETAIRSGVDISKLDSSDRASKRKDILDEGGITSRVKEEIGYPGTMQVPVSRFLGSIVETAIHSGVDISKLDSSDRASKRKDILGEGGITSRVKEEIGCPGTMQVPVSRPQLHGSVEAFGVGRPHTHESIKADSSQGSQNQQQVKRRELGKEVPQIAGSCSVVVKAEVQEAVNDCSAACPSRLLDTVTKSGMHVKAEEHEAKPDEIREMKGLQGLSQVKAEKHATSPRNRETETSLCLGFFPSTRVKLSVAGRSRGNPGAASVGALIRDESGKWITGYNLNLGISTCLASDLWALYHGMKFTMDRGYKKFRVESDSAAAVESLKNAPSHLNSDRDLIESCRVLINGEWDCKVYVIRREENLCAKWLAANAEGRPLELCRVHLPPLELLPFLEDDYKRIGELIPFLEDDYKRIDELIPFLEDDYKRIGQNC